MFILAIVVGRGTSRRKKGNGRFRGHSFGINLEDAVTQLPARLFNPLSLQGGYEGVSTKGCNLYSTSGAEGIYRRKMGVPYGLQLGFDKFDKLAEVTLTYGQSGEFSKSKCMEVFLRTHAWMSGAFGKAKSNLKVEPGSRNQPFTLAAPDLPSVTVSQTADGSIVDSIGFDSNPQGQEGSIFFSMIPSIPHCTVWASLKNPPPSNASAAKR